MARIPKLDSAGKFLAADVNAQIDARTKATLRADLPALAKELKIGGVDGSVPIFPTLAEAAAWEAANPGKKALTLEPSTPDTTAPNPGVLSVTTSQTSATLTVSGASDDRGVAGYAFKVGSGAWSAWQDSGSYTASGLTQSTSYTFQHKVKDAAGNETLGTSVAKSTTAAPVADTTAPTWSATLTVGTPTETSVVVMASALATDNVGVTGYEVTYNGTTWSAITPAGKNFTLSGSAGQTYTGTKLRAKDGAGNVSAALAVPSYTMAATPPTPPTLADTFDGKTGPLPGQLTTTGGKAWQAAKNLDFGSTVTTDSGVLSASGGAAVGPGLALVDTGQTTGQLTCAYAFNGAGSLRFGFGHKSGTAAQGAGVTVQLTPTGVSIFLGNVAIPNAGVAQPPAQGTLTITITTTTVTVSVNGSTLATGTLTRAVPGTLAGLWLYTGATVDSFEVRP